jgi:hypothetical protein
LKAELELELKVPIKKTKEGGPESEQNDKLEY